MAEEVRPWHRLENESAIAYAAFCAYYLLLAHERSIDAAWSKSATKQHQKRDGKRAPGNWAKWSSEHDWVARALAHDEYLAGQDELLWTERRRQLREQDWDNAQEARDIIAEALPEASRFVERREKWIKGKDGAPDQLIITESFNIMGLMRALTDASKLQRLATDEPTENINNLSGAALNAAIDREFAKRLAELAHGGQAGASVGAPEVSADSKRVPNGRNAEMQE